MERRAFSAPRRRVQVPQVKGGSGTKPPVVHWKAHDCNPTHSGPRPCSHQMPVGVRGPGTEIRSGDSRHHRVGNPTLETSRAFPCSRCPSVAPDAGVHADYDSAEGGAAAHADSRPSGGNPTSLSGYLVLDDHPAPVLAGPHDSSPVWEPFLPYQRPGGHPDQRH